MLVGRNDLKIFENVCSIRILAVSCAEQSRTDTRFYLMFYAVFDRTNF